MPSVAEQQQLSSSRLDFFFLQFISSVRDALHLLLTTSSSDNMRSLLAVTMETGTGFLCAVIPTSVAVGN